jgi:hypothetical protein
LDFASRGESHDDRQEPQPAIRVCRSHAGGPNIAASLRSNGFA